MSKKRGRANKKLKYKNVMQRVPFKNRLSWRQREKGRYFYTHSISKTARFPCCCDQVKEENNYKKVTLTDYGEMDSGARSRSVKF